MSHSVPDDHLHLDISCLRHLVTRCDFARALFPSSVELDRLEATIFRVYGSNIPSRHVVTQIFHTALTSINRSLTLENVQNGNTTISINKMVRYLFRLDLALDLFTIEIRKLCLLATTHAALAYLPFVSRPDLEGTFGGFKDLLGHKGWGVDLDELKTEIYEVVKRACRHVYSLSKKSLSILKKNPENIARPFHKRHPLARMRKSLKAHLHSIDQQLPPLSFDEDEHRGLRREKDEDEQVAAQMVGEIDASEDLPAFFSDGEDGWQGRSIRVKVEGKVAKFSQVASDSESNVNGEEDYVHNLRPLPGKGKIRGRKRGTRHSNLELASNANGKEPQENSFLSRARTKRRKRSYYGAYNEVQKEDPMIDADLEPKIWPESGEHVEVEIHGKSLLEREPEGNYTDLIEGASKDAIPEKISNSDLAEISMIGSEMFWSDNPSESEIVARQSKSNRTKTMERELRRVMVAPVNMETEEVVAAPLQDNETEDVDSDRFEEELDEMEGHQGKNLRELRTAVADMKSRSRIPDPLPRAIADAKRASQARKTRGKSGMVNRYSPDSNARPASPIPDSEETPMRRKKKIRLQLDSDSESSYHQRTRGRSRSRRRTSAKIFGKVARSGRFQPHEDDQLISGLKKYGWGMWTDIAKNFGSNHSTRTPMSLKDRARTLELNPDSYPTAETKRGRPIVRSPTKPQEREMDKNEEIEKASAGGSEDDK